MDTAIHAARWVVGKALAPVADGVLEAWAASTELGANMEALRMELLYVQGVLNNTHGREIDNPALNVLLQKLRDLAHNAEDVLDTIDYFRIQDELYGTNEAADGHAMGCVPKLVLNARHTAKDVSKLFQFSACACAAKPSDPDDSGEDTEGTDEDVAVQKVSCCTWPCTKWRRPRNNTSLVPHDAQATDMVNEYMDEPKQENMTQKVVCCSWPCSGQRMADDNSSSVEHNNQGTEEVKGCIRKLASCARNTIRAVGKHFPCSFIPPIDVEDEGDDDQSDKNGGENIDEDNNNDSVNYSSDSDTSILHGASVNEAPERKQTKETTMSEFDRVGLSRRMVHIVKQLKPVCEKVSTILNLELLGAKHSTAASIPTESHPITTPESLEPKLYGRDSIVSSIVDDITKGKYCDEQLTVLPIVGPGGIGKTTLIKDIYHNLEVQKHFHVQTWICVSLNFNVDKLTKKIANDIAEVDQKNDIRGPEEITEEPKREVQDKKKDAEVIQQTLKSKKILLILDDMWKCSNEKEWKRLLLPFRKSKVKGNIILVTTRFPALAQMVKTIDCPIELGAIAHEEFRKLFLAFVFGEEQPREEYNKLLEIGDKIIEKLKGSPLAAKTVGRLLRNHLDLYSWRRVLESKEWELENGSLDIMPALKLSYYYLPFHLQQCFSYCALFPEDHKFDSEELIYYWLGLDILHSSDERKTSEEIAESNLNELVNYGFFKRDEIDGRTHYILHDLLHNLALKVASHECFSVHRSNVRSVKIRPSVRHLSVNIAIADESDEITDEKFSAELRKLKARLKIGNLQTLVLFIDFDDSDGIFADSLNELLREATALRVLRLPVMSCSVEAISHSISALVHLRYLRLETMVYNDEMDLPSTLSRFYHLKILDLQEWDGCPLLPTDMSNLSKLCHFVTKHGRYHSDICNVGKLKLLQELKVFQVNKESEGFEPKQLENLIELRELGIYNLEKINREEEAAEAKLIDKNYLHKLTLDWGGQYQSTNSDVEQVVVLERLKPHRNLQNLCIRGHKGHSCPTWLGDELDVEALQSLHLVGVSWEVFPSFGQICDLSELTLGRIATIKEFTLEQSFCNLTRLTLIGLKSLKDWVVPHDTHLFPSLKVLVIRHCPELLGFPFFNHTHLPEKKKWNTDWLPRLEKLKVNNCPKVLLLPPIPWTKTLCSVRIRDVGSKILDTLDYSKSASGVELEITGKAGMRSLDHVLVFNKLAELEELTVKNCSPSWSTKKYPPLKLKHVLMLAKLKKLTAEESDAQLWSLEGQSNVQWELPIEDLKINSNLASGKKLTWLLSHLPKLCKLEISICPKITNLVVEMDLQQTETTVPSSESLDLKMKELQATDEDQQIATKKEVSKEEDGLLVLPSHLCNSLQNLVISCLPEKNLMVSSLHDLHALDTLFVLTRCSLSFSSSCYPFPSSLTSLSLMEVEGLKTLEPLSNLSSLICLYLEQLEDLRCEGLRHLLTQGELLVLSVLECPKFFVGSDAMWDQEEQEFLKLEDLYTDDIAGFLAAPICRIVSSSLTKLVFSEQKEMERLTKEQEGALQLFTSLEKLKFSSCSKLQHLPAGLNRLINLQKLTIKECPAIQSMPKGDLPTSLENINISECGNEELQNDPRYKSWLSS